MNRYPHLISTAGGLACYWLGLWAVEAYAVSGPNGYALGFVLALAVCGWVADRALKVAKRELDRAQREENQETPMKVKTNIKAGSREGIGGSG